MIKILTGLALAFLILSTIISAPICYGLTGWSKTYTVKEYGVAALTTTSDGGIVVTGREGFQKVWLAKIDVSGNTIWTNTLDGVTPFAYSITQTSDGGYALAGGESVNFVGASVWVAKVDSSGSLLWNKTYDKGFATAIVQTTDGGYAVAGKRDASAFLTKIDSSGNKDWIRYYGSNPNSSLPDEYVPYSAEAMVKTDDGGYLLVGQAPRSEGSLISISWMCKIDSSGIAEWNKTCEGGDLYSVAKLSDGGYAAITCKGDENNPGTSGDYHYIPLLVGLDSNGNTKWSKTYPGPVSSVLFSVISTSDGGLALSGYIKSEGANDLDGYLLKTDSAGNAQWNRTYGGEGKDTFDGITETTDKGFVLVGSTNYSSSGEDMLWLVKVDGSGAIPEFSLPVIGLLIVVTLAAILVWKRYGENSCFKSIKRQLISN